MSACVRGCAMLRKHLDECDGQDPTGRDCRGCLPRQAEYGHLCWPCHRRLQLMLTDAPTVDRWLTGNLPAGEGAARVRQDFERSPSSDGSPAPIKVAIFDVRQHLGDSLAEYVDELCEAESLRGPDRHSVEADAGYLLTWLDRLEKRDYVGDWWEHLAELMSEAHALAPWRPDVRRINGIGCPECGECALVIFGGESDVTCTRCRAVITEQMFGLWEQIVKDGKVEA